MPTGYTAAIQDKPNLTFRDFALSCARGMGACIMQRDDPANDPPKAPDKSDYHVKALLGVRERLSVLHAMTPAERQAEFNSVAAEIRNHNAEHEAKRVELLRRYEAMREKVMAWEPPTPDHVGMKNFMLEQIGESIKFDCSTYRVPEPSSMEAWWGEEVRIAQRNIAYHTEEDSKEDQRTKDRADWIAKLYKSLEG